MGAWVEGCWVGAASYGGPTFSVPLDFLEGGVGAMECRLGLLLPSPPRARREEFSTVLCLGGVRQSL